MGRYYLNGGSAGTAALKYILQQVDIDKDNIEEAKEVLTRYVNSINADNTAARKYFQQAVDQGDTEGMKALASIYIDERDYDKARNYVQQAIDRGDDDALGMLSLFYKYGWGVEQDSTKAYELERDSDMSAKDSFMPEKLRQFLKKLRR